MDNSQISFSVEEMRDINLAQRQVETATREARLIIEKSHAVYQMELFKLFAMRGLKISDWMIHPQEDGSALLTKKVENNAPE